MLKLDLEFPTQINNLSPRAHGLPRCASRPGQHEDLLGVPGEGGRADSRWGQRGAVTRAARVSLIREAGEIIF